MRLTKREMDALEIREKRYSVHESNGLYLEVMPSGSKIWRLRFQHEGKQKVVTIGEYPKLGVKEARFAAIRKRDEIINGGVTKGAPFSYYAEKWLERHITNKVSPVTRETIVSRLDNHILPAFGNKPMTDIKLQDINRLMQALLAADKIPTARRCLSVIGRIFRYAIGARASW